MQARDSETSIDPDTQCGIGCFKPKWLQAWATSRVYVALFSLNGVLSGSYYSYLTACMSTLEKRFAFTSKISGLIMTVDEVTPLLLGVFVGYFGGKAHRPRIVGLGMLMGSACAFVSALPYFIYGPAIPTLVGLNSIASNKTTSEFCDGVVRNESCGADDRPPTFVAVFLLMFGSFLKGFGSLAYYSIGVAYMDDNSKKRNTPMYFAVAIALRLLGPLLGYLMSSLFLKFPEDPFANPEFGQEDPRWIGGWWMGFVLQGFLLILSAVPISLFPKRLPGYQVQSTVPDSKENRKLISSMSGLPAALKRLVKNPLFVLLSINMVFVIFGNFGHYVLLPRYMEQQFKVSASKASSLAGPPGLAAVILSTLTGGFLIWKFKPTAKRVTLGMAFLQAASALSYLILMSITCTNVEMSHSGSGPKGLILNNTCNSICDCSTKSFSPVCGPDGNFIYFSPCYAGCKGYSEKVFTNCSCVSDSSGLNRDFAAEGFCVAEGCWSQALIYLITEVIFDFVSSLLRVTYTLMLLRSICPGDKSLAIGAFEAFISTFGFIPQPVIFGALVDSACLVWEESCGQSGNCWFYDVDKFNYLLHGASAMLTGLSALCLTAVHLLSGRMRDLYEEEDVGQTQDINMTSVPKVPENNLTSSNRGYADDELNVT